MLDNEFASMIIPLYYMSSFFGLRKFDLSGKNVSKNTIFYVLHSIVGMSIAYFLLISTLSPLVYVYDESIFLVYVIAYTQYCISYTILSFFNYWQRENNVKLIMKLQTIDRFLYNKNDTKKVSLVVWIMCSTLLTVYAFFFTLKLLYDPLWNWTRASFIIIAIIFDIELANVIMVVYYAACKTNRWSQILQVDKRNPLALQDEIGVAFAEVMSKIYEDILDTLTLLKTTAQTTILLHFVIMFIQSLTYIEILILLTQAQRIQSASVISHAYGVSVWVTKAIVTVAMFCIICELLYRKITSAQIVVLSNRNLCNSRTARRFFKNMRRLNRTQFKKIKVCGIFTVDAALTLRLAGLIADYTVILLQFAFLRN